MKTYAICVAFLFAALARVCTGADEPSSLVGDITEINTALMRSTFRFEGSGSIGTIFILGVPLPDGSGRFRYVLVTAAHVLEAAKADQATLNLRVTVDGKIVKFPCGIQIRDGGKPLWVRHPRSDVAAMFVTVPGNIDIQVLAPSLFADDAFFAAAHIHPGDELFTLGFPLGADSNEVGYPILRKGAIASYPLVPVATNETFLLDLEIRPGNSGGPVYLYQLNRMIEKDASRTVNLSRIMGLISQQKVITEKTTRLYEARTEQYPLNVAVVIHAALIKDTINLLMETLNKPAQ